MTLIAGALENLSFLTMAVLAVVGGAVFGALLTQFVVWLIGKYWLTRQLPWGPKKALRILGAIAGALLVGGLLHLSGGGWGLFGGGGSGTGSSGDSGGTTKGGQSIPENSKHAPKSDPTTAAPPRAEDRVRVTVLGGSLVSGRAFYRLDGQRAATDLKGVQDAVKARREQPGATVAAVDILIYQNSLGENTEPVRQLKAWVTASGLTPNSVVLSGEIPAP